MYAADLHRLARALREIALLATQNVGAETVNAGELAVVEDIARHPGSSITDVTRRTGLAQSLVSRITRAMGEAGVVRVRPDPDDGRRTRLDLDPAGRALIVGRGRRSITSAVTARTPSLSRSERAELTRHLEAAARLIERGSGRDTS